jgi:hypothetical protein
MNIGEEDHMNAIETARQVAIRDMLTNAADYVVINDGAVQYPVLRDDLRDGDTEDSIRDMDSDEYAAFCTAVGYDARAYTAGSGELNRLTDSMIERGATYWRVG